jgi:hypothetical protein
VRAAAARALGRLGSPAALPALAAAQADPDPAVQAAAGRALELLRAGAPSGAASATPGGGVLQGVLQIVLFQVDPGPGAEAADVGQVLDEVAPDALAAGADVQIVTMVPGRPLPTEAEALTIIRRQFRTAPPGYTWQPARHVDAAGRAYLILQLRPAD